MTALHQLITQFLLPPVDALPKDLYDRNFEHYKKTIVDNLKQRITLYPELYKLIKDRPIDDEQFTDDETKTLTEIEHKYDLKLKLFGTYELVSFLYEETSEVIPYTLSSAYE